MPLNEVWLNSGRWCWFIGIQRDDGVNQDGFDNMTYSKPSLSTRDLYTAYNFILPQIALPSSRMRRVFNKVLQEGHEIQGSSGIRITVRFMQISTWIPNRPI
jgi:hypothetical protein